MLKTCRVRKQNDVHDAKKMCERRGVSLIFFHLFNSLQLSRLSCWLQSWPNFQHHEARTCRHSQETRSQLLQTNTELHHRDKADLILLLSQDQTTALQLNSNHDHSTAHLLSNSHAINILPHSQVLTTELLLNSQAQTTAHQLNSQALTTELPLNSQARTTAHHHNSQALTTDHPRLTMEFHPHKTLITLTASVQTAINKLHQAHMAPQQQATLTRNQTTTDTITTITTTAATATADTKSQPNTNSNMMFKMNKLVSILDTKNSAKVQSPLENITFCCPTVVNR